MEPSGSEFDGCRLCIEIEDFEESAFGKRFAGVVSNNRFLEQTHLQVMIPLGPVCVGHLLVVTKRHYWSYGECPNEIIQELLQAIGEISSRIEKWFPGNRAFAFEHGAVSRLNKGGACLDHAHMNLVPIPESVRILENDAQFHTFRPCDLGELGSFVRRSEPYLFSSWPIEGSFAAPAPLACSQFFRKLLARKIPGYISDWRDNAGTPAVKATATLLQSESGAMEWKSIP